MLRHFILAWVLALVACTAVPTDNQLAVAATHSIRLIAIQVDRAERNGWITNEQETEYMQKLREANQMVREAEALMDVCTTDCHAATEQLQTVDALLGEIEQRLREAEQ